MTRKPPRDLLAAGALVVSLAFAGCSLMRSDEVQLDSTAGLFEQAHLTYQVDTAGLNASGPLATSAASGAQLASYQTGGAGLPPGVATVQVQFPHPEKRPGMAKVTVRIEDQPGAAPKTLSTAEVSGSTVGGWRRWWESTRGNLAGLRGKGTSYEVWTLDIPSAEVSEMVNQLRASGYFDNYAEPGNETDVVMELDGARVQKRWQRVARLDRLVERVRNSGTLLASSRPVDQSKPAGSVLAYRQMRAEEEGFALATDQSSPAGPQPAIQMTRLPAVNTAVQR